MKNKLSRAVLSLVLSAPAGLVSPLFAVGAEVGVSLVQQQPWGSFGYQGTVLDLKNDLNYGTKNTFSARVKVDMPLLFPNLYLQAMPLKFEGTGIRTVSFTFANQTYTANQGFTSSLKLDHYDLALYYGIPFLTTATNDILNAELGLNARFIDFKAEVSQPTSGISQSKSSTLAVPMGYIGLHIEPFDWLKLQNEARATAYGSNRYVDLSSKLKVTLFKLAYVAGGYKFQELSINYQDIIANVRFGGPIGEVGVEF